MSPTERAALEVLWAIDNPGPRPDYHRAVMERHRAEWPTLWRALDNLSESMRPQ